MNHTKYLALLAGCSFVAACENPVDGDLNVDNPDAYTLVYTVNAVENDSKSTLTFPLERDTVFSVYANLSCIRDPGSDITVEFRTAAELVDAYNEEKQTSYAAMPEACYTIDDTRAVIPNGKYISSPVTIRLNSAAFDGVGTFLLPITIERVTPDLPVSPTLGTAYLRINGTYTTNPFRPIDRSGWSVEAFSTEEPEAQTGYDDNGKAFSAIDDAPCTYWGTQWRNAKPGPPHWITIDMGKSEELHGFTIRGHLQRGRERRQRLLDPRRHLHRRKPDRERSLPRPQGDGTLLPHNGHRHAGRHVPDLHRRHQGVLIRTTNR